MVRRPCLLSCGLWQYYRADKLLEARLEDLMAEPGISEARKTELQQSFNMADAWGTCEDIQKELIKYITCLPRRQQQPSPTVVFNMPCAYCVPVPCPGTR